MKQYPAAEVERVRSHYWDDHMGLRDIAKHIGRSYNYVRRIMDNHGIERRSTGEKADPQTTAPAAGFRHPQAYCRDLDPDLFFPDSAAGRAEAADICRSHCLVMEGCLRYALATGEEFGVWGGCTEGQRVKITKRLTDNPLAILATAVLSLTNECESCEASFVPLVDGLRTHCADADEAVA